MSPLRPRVDMLFLCSSAGKSKYFSASGWRELKVRRTCLGISRVDRLYCIQSDSTTVRSLNIRLLKFPLVVSL